MTPEQRFREILSFAWQNSRFYRDLYAQSGIRERDLSQVRLDELPVVSKSQLSSRWDEVVTDPRLKQEDIQAWMSRNPHPLSLYLDRYIIVYSSGSSAFFPYTPETWRHAATRAALEMRPAASVPIRSAFFFPAEHHFSSAVHVHLASRSAHQALQLWMTDPVEEILAQLNSFKPERLTGYASAMAWLAEWTLEKRLHIAPTFVVVSGDALTPSIRSLIQEAWAPKIMDLYSATESLFIALRQPGEASYRVWTDLNAVEVVNASQRQVHSGERGRVLITSLLQETLPLIRFDLDDLATSGDTGFGVTVLQSVDGKVSDSLPVRLADGRVFRIPGHEIMGLSIQGLQRIQVVSHSPDQVTVRYQARTDLASQVQESLQTLLNAHHVRLRSLDIERVAGVPNEAVSFKCLSVVRPDQMRLRLPSLSEGVCPPLSIVPPLSGRRGDREGGEALLDRFQAIVHEQPEAIAVRDHDRQLSYGELARLSSQVASSLIRAGVSMRRPIALLCDRRVDTIPLILGALKAGGFYLPLDVHLPAGRLETLLTQARPEAMLTVARLRDMANSLSGVPPVLLCLEECLGSDAQDRPGPGSDRLACIVYTSGSTGTPKGVVFSHQTILNRIQRYVADYHLGPADTLSMFQSFAVNAGVREIFGALLSGATLALYDVASQGLQGVASWAERNELTVLYAAPSLWRHMVQSLQEASFPLVRVVRLGGEAVLPEDWLGFKALCRPGGQLVNAYATTEAGTLCQHVMDHDSRLIAGRIPVGIPLPGSEVSLRDAQGPVGIHAVGEIHADGTSLAAGYWDETECRVLPFERPMGQGDLGYQLSDGRIFLTGRKDLIVNVHGYRIHLSEIEKAVLGIQGIQAAAAVVRKDRDVGPTIAVYFVPEPGKTFALSDLRLAAASGLPGPAVPSAFVPVPGLPRLPGGKVNRDLLSQEPLQGAETQEDAIPANEVESRLAQIWKECLGIHSIPAEATFFDLGGDSLAVLRVVARIQEEFGVDVPIRHFFSHLTLPALARMMEGEDWGGRAR